ncbi:unnamed protein product [Ceutorhynchus assimilis]|uniref:Uncharacterized protein n=1 Tax=Ceutorhynchus assimilis TaxID=467358 RepID=A0A9N9MW94_9CUCU|nr:unnamed protein product [Ceutorhynchus assimilis]
MDDDPEEIICVKCEKSISDDCFECDCCLGRMHRTCALLGGSETKVMPLQKRVLMLICEKCKKYLIRMPYMIKMIDDLRDEIQELKSSIKNGGTQQGETYAQILRKEGRIDNAQRVQINYSTPTLIIKPKAKQSSEKTKNELQTKINPVQLKVGIKNLKEANHGNVIVKCTTKQDIELFKNEAEKQLKGQYVIETPKLRMPRIKIVGYTGNKSAEEIEESIMVQNNWIKQNDKLKITYVKKNNSKNQSTVFGECSPELFSKMIDASKICIDWERFSVYEDLNITRCYNCQGYRHKGSTCNATQVCGNCSGEHDIKECSRQEKACGNCISANNQYNTKYDTNHAAFDASCPTTNYYLKIMRSRIDYYGSS